MDKSETLFRAMVKAWENREPRAAAWLHKQLGHHSTVGCPVCADKTKP